MKKSHAGFWVGIALMLIAAVYSAVLFLVKETFDITAWVLYGATMTAFLLTGIQAIASAHAGKAVVIDTALGIASAVYLVVQCIFGGMIFINERNLSLTVVVICEILILAGYLVVAFAVNAAQSSNAAQTKNDQMAVRKMRFLERDILSMADRANDSKVKEALKKLAEDVHYSDVSKRSDLWNVEEPISRNLAALQAEMQSEDADPLARIDEIRNLLAERNRMA